MTTPPGGEWRDRPLPDHLTVPDDASDLELDRLALERERAAARRKARWRRLLFTRRWATHGLSGPLVAACLLVVFLFAALPTLLAPRGGRTPESQLPLAQSTVPAGEVRSTLPVEELHALGATATDRDSPSLRPGALVVVPAACEANTKTLSDCAAAVANITSEARSYDFDTWLVGGTSDAALLAMARAPGANSTAYPYHEDKHLLLQSFAAGTLPTAVFIDRHGLVQSVVTGVTADRALGGVLDRLVGVPT